MGKPTYPPVKGGQWVQPKRRGYRMACCDCGLIHRMNFRVLTSGRGKFIQFQAYRDERKTAAYRRANRIKVRGK